MPSTRRPRAFQRFALFASTLLVAAVFAAIAATFWFLRDPERELRERHAGVAAVHEDSALVRGVHSEQDVTVTATNGLGVELRVRRPAAQTGRLPLFVLLGGHMRGKESASLITETGPRVVASLSYPFDGNERAKGFAVALEVPAIRRAIYDTPPATMLALDYLLTRPDVDTTRVELVGASFGAPFATIAAALDTRFTRLWIVQGGAHPYVLLDRGLEGEVPWAPARAAVAGLATILASGPRFDPAKWVGRVSPRPVMMINTTGDERVPRATSEALYAAAREPKEIVWLPGQHMQPNRRPVLDALIGAVFARAK